MQRDRKDLKIQALLERISNLTASYEDRVADLRVELTVAEEDNKGLLQRIQELQVPTETQNVEEPGEVVQGEVVYPDDAN